MRQCKHGHQVDGCYPCEIDLLEVKLKMAKEALEFYADAINFRAALSFTKKIDSGALKGATYDDPRYSFNKKAKETLEKLK
jgi:hypothetical protein